MKEKAWPVRYGVLETGLEDIEFMLWRGIFFPYPVVDDLHKTLISIINQSKEVRNDEAMVWHIRQLAGWVASLAEELDDEIKHNRITPENAAIMGIYIGMWHYRFKQWIHEQPARSGKKSQAAARQKGRTPPSGSLPEFYLGIDNRKNKTTGQLVQILKNRFPNRTQANITRQIRSLKKRGL